MTRFGTSSTSAAGGYLVAGLIGALIALAAVWFLMFKPIKE